jgi:hypothetical protein
MDALPGVIARLRALSPLYKTRGSRDAVTAATSAHPKGSDR